MSDYKPIDDEDLWGVPPEDMPETKENVRNFFNEGQKIISPPDPGGSNGQDLQ